MSRLSHSATPSRRRFLANLATGAAGLAGLGSLFHTPGAFADELFRTPELTEGPFYPDHLPLDTDNDLIILGDGLTPAVGEITHLTGRLLDVRGNPLRNMTVEIWQCDANEVYHHTADLSTTKKKPDRNFQGFGRFTTGSTGEYRFRTIKPVPYPGRPAPHIHVKVKRGDREVLTTQINIAGHPGNPVDGVVRSAGGLIERELTMAEWKRVEGSKLGEWAARHDLILGRTPDEGAGTRS
ncbi:Protocatechuate 3,4-dioxygenase beta chain [Aquisphaera giovannonii]|uniref:Protocatechuate 3,4-dioxygenase beta chain n=1 Tax=Aquisphaera giovannonii TaxID=406548 RepID=A0A5B9W8S5_9BACT|nr:protocatechuate 3,4-dioxygenase [Aquisphaera giovannonii]QEH37036.1 Protocatechuate 3,4-dioxygenase beta chain [Aquisphaera giovannonii]